MEAPPEGGRRQAAYVSVGLLVTSLYTTQSTRLFTLDATDQGGTLWTQPRLPGGGWEDAGGLLIGGDVVYGTTYEHRLLGFDRNEGGGA